MVRGMLDHNYCFRAPSATRVRWETRAPNEVSDSAAAESRPDSGTGSRLFEFNLWMWRYKREFPRKISVKDAEKMQWARVMASRRKGGETMKQRRLAGKGPGINFTRCILYHIVYDIIREIM